jgi:long-chain fatty acid transport protein
VLCSVLALSPEARSAGFGIDFEGARALGMATAGSASAADASSVFYNPAGIARLPTGEAILGAQGFLFENRYRDAGSTLPDGLGPIPGGNGRSGIPAALVPWGYGSLRATETLSLGIGIFSPFGLGTRYGTDFVGRYQNMTTRVVTVDINPVLSWRPVSWLSIGGGPSIEYAHLRLTQAIDFGSSCALQLGAPACGGAFGLQPGASDGGTDLRGDSVGVGVSLGVMADLSPETRIGLSYRSGIRHDFRDARQGFQVPEAARALLALGGTPNALTGGTARLNLPLPSRITIGLRQVLTPRLELMADATVTQWSVFRSTLVTPNNPATGATAFVRQNYRDAWRFAVGLEHRLSEMWSLRAGVGYDQTPVPASGVQPALPDRDRVYGSVGASVQFAHALSVDVGYSYVSYVGRIPMDSTGANGDRVRGSFSVGGSVVGAQFRLGF